ncbi:hypothetical protein KIL84_010262 [Mauremys mutica]|uniref:Uncharacterized protein n=1 Tax=Mauremys mutica TaxID=74926 RepID=A0A9D3XM96_9SAUR|nr:hypothetical protein KIL84_010262 [Mauremys mutica]
MSVWEGPGAGERLVGQAHEASTEYLSSSLAERRCTTKPCTTLLSSSSKTTQASPSGSPRRSGCRSLSHPISTRDGPSVPQVPPPPPLPPPLLPQQQIKIGRRVESKAPARRPMPINLQRAVCGDRQQGRR